MTGKLTYALPVVWQPDRESNTAKQIASSAREVTSIKLAANAGSAYIELYDGLSDDPTSLRWVMDSSTTFPDSNDFSYPLVFKRGIYAKLTQGAGLNPVLTIAIIPDQV